MSEPPRRSTRSRKAQQLAEPSPTKASGINGVPEEIGVDDVMTNPKSKLAQMDLSVSTLTLSFQLRRRGRLKSYS